MKTSKQVKLKVYSYSCKPHYCYNSVVECKVTCERSTHSHCLLCPILTKGSNSQITQTWESDVFRLDLIAYMLLPFRVWSRNTHPAERYLSQDIMTLHWCQCTWQTHLLIIYEMSFSRLASFCQRMAVLYMQSHNHSSGLQKHLQPWFAKHEFIILESWFDSNLLSYGRKHLNLKSNMFYKHNCIIYFCFLCKTPLSLLN